MGKATGTSKCCLKYTKIVPINARALAVTKVCSRGVINGVFASNAPSKAVALEPAAAPCAKNLRSAVRFAVGCTAAYAPAR